MNGAPKDKFHFTYPTDYWQALSQSGQDVSYGISFALLATTPPRKAVVAYVEPNAPTTTTNASMTRGVQITSVDGVDLVNDNTAGRRRQDQRRAVPGGQSVSRTSSACAI